MSKGFKAVILPDVHINDRGYHKCYEPVKKFIKQFKPDKTVLLGDFADSSALSHWNLEKRRKIEGKRHKKEMAMVDKELKYLEKHTKEIIWLEGNHENWVEQYIDKNPEMEGLVEYQVLLRLKERGIKWIAMNDLYKLGDLYLTHGMYANLHHAKKHMEKLGCNICYGHTHMPQEYGCSMRMQKPLKAVCLGCLCGKKPDYLRGKHGNWRNGFAVLYVASNGEFNIYPIDIINNRFYFNGRRWD